MASTVSEASKNAIRRLLWDGRARSKRELAQLTGLSVATCNGALNEMERMGEVAVSERVQGPAGRSTALYRVQEDMGQVLAMRLELSGAKRALVSEVVSVTGRVLARLEETVERVDDEALVHVAACALDRFPGVVQIALGIPGIVQGGVVRDCDAREMDGMHVVSLLEEGTGASVVAGNDMHMKAYGLYRELGIEDEIVTLAYFPHGVRPGTATIYRGEVIEGANSFAGMVGFVPVEGAEGLRAPEPASFAAPCPDLVARCLASVIAVINPDLILCAGDLVDADALSGIEALLGEWIPRRYLPRLEYRDDMDACYVRGLAARALDMRLDGTPSHAMPRAAACRE